MTFFTPAELKDPVAITDKLYHHAYKYFDKESRKTLKELMAIQPQLNRHKADLLAKIENECKAYQAELELSWADRHKEEIRAFEDSLRKTQYPARQQYLAKLKEQYESRIAAINNRPVVNGVAQIADENKALKTIHDEYEAAQQARIMQDAKAAEDAMKNLKLKLKADDEKLVQKKRELCQLAMAKSIQAYTDTLLANSSNSFRRLSATLMTPGTSLSYAVRKTCLLLADELMDGIIGARHDVDVTNPVAPNVLQCRKNTLDEFERQQVLAKIISILERHKQMQLDGVDTANQNNAVGKSNFFKDMMAALDEINDAYPVVSQQRTRILSYQRISSVA